MVKSLYLTDLNPGRNYGLNHELWCIVTAIMIGDNTNRDIMVSGFYPDYNSDYKVDLNRIIDISKTNENFRKLGVKSKLVPFRENIPWVMTKDQNPVFKPDICGLWGKERFYRVIEKLNFEEQYMYINLYTTFVWPIMGTFGLDDELCERAIRIFLCIEPSTMVKLFVEQKMSELELGDNYYSLHMRLEDDWINHLTTWDGTSNKGKTFEELSENFYNEIIGLIDTHMDMEDNKIFVATGLLKNENRNNNLLIDLEKKYPGKITYSSNSTENLAVCFPLAKSCREIEGFIDFLICTKSKKCILSTHSSFSVSLSYVLPFLDKETLKYSG